MFFKYKNFISITVFSLLMYSLAQAAYSQTNNDYSLLSLEDLSNTIVTTANKKPEVKFKTASAVTVITNEDILRSGATSIPDVLRFVPGIFVGQIDANRWAVSSRGFNRQLSNKLLVLIDGRSVYTPLFSGVFWDSQSMIMEDIDRIEVVRGPGGTLWGANAVNGVINIITKNAQNTKGNHVSILYGDQEDGTVDIRHGGSFKSNMHYRIFAKSERKDETINLADQTGNDDDWYQNKVGFRLDTDALKDERFSLSGEIRSGRLNQFQNFPGLITPGVLSPVRDEEDTFGFYLLGDWEKQSQNSVHKITSYIDYDERDSEQILDLQILTLDINYENIRQINERNELVWGLGLRHIRDNLKNVVQDNGQTYVDYFPNDISGTIYNAFIQNEFQLIPNKVHLTLGSKIEDHYFTGTNIQPNARLAWFPNEKNTVWGAVSRAVRTPTRGEADIILTPVSSQFGFVRLTGSSEFKNEDLIAYELGHRVKVNQNLSLDTTAFYNKYDNLRSLEPGVSEFETGSNTALTFVTENRAQGTGLGFEIEAKYTPTDNWTLSANYSLIKLDLDTDRGSLDTSNADEEANTAEHQFALLSRLNISGDLALDTNLAYVDSIESFDYEDYWRLDMRLGWKPSDNTEISLVGQNLLDSAHPEFQPFLFTPPAEISRSAYVKMKVNF